MANETPTITGESRVINVYSIYGGAFGEKLKKVNRKLAKQGLGECKVLGCEMVNIPVMVDGEESTVNGYNYTVQIPFVAKKIEGHTLIGTVEVASKTRKAWLERLWQAMVDDEMPWIERLGDHWGTLCGSPEVASAWADELLPGLRAAWAPGAKGHG